MKKEDRRIHTSSLKWISKVTGSDRKRVFFILCIQIAQALASLYLAMALRTFVNSAVSKDVTAFRTYVFILLGVLLLMIGMSSGLRFLKEYTTTSIYKKFQMRELKEILDKAYAQVSGIHSGEWMNRINSDANVVSSGVTNILPNVVSMCVRLVGALYLLVRMIPEVAYIIIPGGCILGILTFLFRGKLKRMHKEQQEAQGRFRIFLQERLQNLLVIHSFSKEADVMKEGSQINEEYRKKHIARDNFSNICNVGFAIVMDGAYILGICYCGYRILQGTMEYGTLIAVMNLVSQVQSPFANLSGYVPQYYAMQASAERLMEVEEFADAFAEPPLNSSSISDFYNNELLSIDLAGISFSYDVGSVVGEEDRTEEKKTRHVLHNFSTSIPKGSIVAVTGPSGCGKSTMLKILMCLYPLDGGEVLLRTQDGEQKLDGKWRGLYAYVPQGNQLMAGSIREVVTFGNEEKYGDEEGIWRALKVADAEEFVRLLPEGLDSKLGEHGSGLSEGQVQRLALARAVYAEHPILLLDESTSSLDEKTEHDVLTNIKKLTNCTVVLVTHRKAPLGICDVQIDMGEIAAQQG